MKNILKFKINNYTYLFILLSFLCGQIKNTIIILFVVIFHELGHILMAKIFKFKIISVEIFPFGGITKIDKPLNTNIIKEIIIALGGIIFNLLLYLINNELLFKYNSYIILFNILPIIPLDGSKILFEIYCIFFSYKKSLNLIIISSIIFLLLFIIYKYNLIINNYIIITFLIYKLIMFIKSRSINYHKFILERMINNYNYYNVDNNKPINNYKKGYKYYYLYKNKIISEKDYLNNICKY